MRVRGKFRAGATTQRRLTVRWIAGASQRGSRGIYEYFWNSTSRLAIRRIDFDNPRDTARHDRMVTLVEQMLAAKQHEAAASGQAKEIAARKCAALDRQIDALVYELYGLSAEEIALVEGAA